MHEPTQVSSDDEPADMQLWQRWRQGERSDVVAFLSDFPNLDGTEVVAALLVDQRERWLLGERVPAESYLRRFPALENDAETLVELVYGEYLLREERGEQPRLDEYLWRFPCHQDRLRLQVECHQALQRDATTASLSLTQATLSRAPEPVEGAPLLPGYEVLEELGRGGMGVVYKARQLKADRVVALKVVLVGGHASDAQIERFRREAEAIARLQHPNIVQVFEVGEHLGLPYFSLEFCAGGSLDRKLAGRPLPAMQAALLLERLAGAAQAAHEKHIVHRDLKPANVLLAEDGTPRISDFGLARMLDVGGQTQTGALLGTPSYMAPEQARGNSDEAGPTADVYALGALLYECLIGRPPFKATTSAETVRQVLEQEPMPPRRLNAAVPRDLETICLKCLGKEPEKRYRSAAELADDLRRFLDDRPIRARRSGVAEQLGRWCRRNPAVAGLLAAVFLSLLVGTGGATFFAIRANENAAQARKKQAEAEAAEHGQREQLLESLMAEARVKRFSGRGGQRFGTLEAIRKAAALARELERPAATFDELRNLAIAALALPDLHVLQEWEGWPEGSQAIAFDDMLERYARLERDGTITVRRVADDAEIARWTGEGRIVSLSFDKGGRAVILLEADDKSRTRWRFDGGEAVPPGKNPAPFAEDSDTIVTADRKLLVTLDRKAGLIGVHDLGTGAHLRDIPFGPWGTNPPVAPGHYLWAMHPWRHELAIGMDGGPKAEEDRTRVLDLDQGRVLAELVPHPSPGPRRHLAWHPDGRTLAVGHWWGVVLWDVPSGKEVLPRIEHKGGWGGFDVGVSLSGQLLSTCSEWGGGVKFWHPYTRKPLLSVPGMTFQPTAPAPDGRMYTHQIKGTHVQIWATEPSPVLRVLVRNPVRGPLREYRRSSVRRDGRLLAVGSDDGVSLFDLSNGLDVGHLDSGTTLNVEFDPATGDLLTLGVLGLLRWPFQADPKDPDRLYVGPPKRLLATTTPTPSFDFHISHDGLTIAVSQFSRVLVLPAEQPDRPVRLAPTLAVRTQVSVSPDGRWVATGGHGVDAVRVWEAATGRLVKSRPFPSAEFPLAQFTPDGKRLLAGTLGKCGFWRTDDWQELPPAITGGSDAGWSGTGPLPEFTPDGQLLAWESGDGALRLLSTVTGRDVARLESPDQGRCGYTTFTPDGRLLITCNKESSAIHVWDLHELRRQLRDMDLDWEAPTDPAAPNEPPTRFRLPPLRVDTPDSMGELAKKWQVAQQTIAEAWDLVMDDPQQRDPTRALKLIEQALHELPDEPLLLNTLGVVQYRKGQYKSALATLDRCLVAGKDGGYFPLPWEATLFEVRADCRAELGQPDVAAADYLRALELSCDEKNPLSDCNGLCDRVAQREEAFARVVELRPDDGGLWVARAHHLVRRHRWKDAAAAYARLTNTPLTYEQSGYLCERAAASVLAGDTDGYVTACAALRARQDETKNPKVTYWLALSCALAPASKEDALEAARLAEQARAGQPPDNTAWRSAASHVQGLAYYRAGEFARAADCLNQCLRTTPEWNGTYLIWPLLALVHERLGDHAEACRWLEKSRGRFEQATRDLSREPLGSVKDLDPGHWVEFQILYREAEALLVGKKGEPGK
jgi:eukaryotic-like serine/threonine-protein kinase